MGWGVSRGDCESAYEGVPVALTVTAGGGVSPVGEGECMSVAVCATPLAAGDFDASLVKPSFSCSGSAICFRLAFLGLGLPFVSYEHVRGTHNHPHGEETKTVSNKE